MAEMLIKKLAFQNGCVTVFLCEEEAVCLAIGHGGHERFLVTFFDILKWVNGRSTVINRELMADGWVAYV